MSVTVKVVQDPDAESPRQYENWGVMACWHNRYKLGDVQPRQSGEEWLADLENVPPGSVILPLYLYDHSGITMSTGKFSCPWDSGQVGWIVATPERMRKMGGWKLITAKRRALVESYLKQEVSTYDDFLTGNVWGYVIEQMHDCSECSAKVHDTEDEDSCWGFIGSDKSTLDAMKHHVDAKHHAALEAAWHNRGA